MASKSGQHIVLGMAGHIDHGKTALVKALTGTDTDRLKEEKERGMTTDLGFAFLGDSITIIDVPGHEKFVKTMVAGVNTVDLALLVIAADDGVMPQTEEHLEILNLLRVSNGLIAINKIDLVEEDWLELVIDEVKELVKGTLFEGGPIVPVSALENSGIDFLKNEILRLATAVHARRDKGIFRIPVDRVFTIKGFGTVVAGTVLSGTVSPDDTVELLPQGRLLRVRGVQVHDHPVKEVSVGFRTAINLGGVEKEVIERGHVLAEPGFFTPTHMLDAQFSLLKSWEKEVKNRTRVRIHIGTSEIIGRVILLDREKYLPGDEGFVQFHFEKPVVADRGDRFVVRSYSPIRTLGGGVILDTHPVRHKRFQESILTKLQNLLSGDPNQIVLEHFNNNRFIPKSVEELATSVGFTKDEMAKRIEELINNSQIQLIGKKRVISTENYKALEQKVLALVKSFHEENPLRFAISAGKLRQLVRQPVDPAVFDEILTGFKQQNVFCIEGDQVRLASHTIKLTPKQEELMLQVRNRFVADLFNPPVFDGLIQQMGERIRALLEYMVESNELVCIESGMYFHRDAVEEAKVRIRALSGKKKQEGFSLGDIKEILEGVPRKKLVALLEYFDRKGFTVRDGDVRKIQ